MQSVIEAYLAQKTLSVNSQKSYLYDLQQFWAAVAPNITATSLLHYQQTLLSLKPSVQQRKLSAVNPFLYYLYESGRLDRFHKLRLPRKQRPMKERPALQDTACLWKETSHKEGQQIALLIRELGLTPSEIARIRRADLDADFRVLSLESKGHRRILSLSSDLLSYVAAPGSATFLFDKKGQPYSRQWFFTRLSAYVASLGHPEWTAQFLREQFILDRLSHGVTREELARELGLKTSLSLETYKEWI